MRDALARLRACGRDAKRALHRDGALFARFGAHKRADAGDRHHRRTAAHGNDLAAHRRIGRLSGRTGNDPRRWRRRVDAARAVPFRRRAHLRGSLARGEVDPLAARQGNHGGGTQPHRPARGGRPVEECRLQLPALQKLPASRIRCGNDMARPQAADHHRRRGRGKRPSPNGVREPELEGNAAHHSGPCEEPLVLRRRVRGAGAALRSVLEAHREPVRG